MTVKSRCFCWLLTQRPVKANCVCCTCTRRFVCDDEHVSAPLPAAVSESFPELYNQDKRLLQAWWWDTKMWRSEEKVWRASHLVKLANSTVHNSGLSGNQISQEWILRRPSHDGLPGQTWSVVFLSNARAITHTVWVMRQKHDPVRNMQWRIIGPLKCLCGCFHLSTLFTCQVWRWFVCISELEETWLGAQASFTSLSAAGLEQTSLYHFITMAPIHRCTTYFATVETCPATTSAQV